MDNTFLVRFSRVISLICFCIPIYLQIALYPFYLQVLPLLFVLFFNWLIFGKITLWITNKHFPNDKT